MKNNVFVSAFNRRLIEDRRKLQDLILQDPIIVYPWWNPCRVNVLLVADGILDFRTNNDFGLSTFVSMLQNDGRSYVKFDITLAHILPDVSDDAVMEGATGIVRSIKGFEFDNDDHFTPTMYDQIWLFGISSSYFGIRENRFDFNSPLHRNEATLRTQELQRINLFMNNGGGVFATGDHGTLGRALCSGIPRVRSMRLWNDTSVVNNLNEVSMNGARRNDTNRLGHDPTSEFDDQSDDIPQDIQPKLYTSWISPWFKETYPHPLLCSRFGRITQMPDHPHEGECVEPSNMAQNDVLGNPEYPFGLGGQISPEVIAHSTVLPGTTSGGKAATQTHSFGSICAYDGHAAGVGRVVTDATWHHFVNVNLVGEIGAVDPVKSQGFLASASGIAVLDRIKEYYINIGVWISPIHRQTCFNTKLIWPLIVHHRVIEAAVIQPNLKLKDFSTHSLYGIGTHAVDVLNNKASQCRRLIWIIQIMDLILPELKQIIDPWQFFPPERTGTLPWIDPNPLINIAVGAGIVAVRDEIGNHFGAVSDEMEERIAKTFETGAKQGVERALGLLDREMSFWAKLEIDDTESYVVKGFVYDKAGNPVEKLRVRAVDQDFTEDNILGEETMTDEKGYFRIPYKASDFIIDGKESGGADIILSFYKGAQKVKTSEVYRNSPKILTVRISLDD